jgi:hypothetical protein
MTKTRKNIVYKVERVEGVSSNEHYDMVKKIVNNKVVERKIFTPKEMKKSVHKTIQKMKKDKNNKNKNFHGGKTERKIKGKKGKNGKKKEKVKIIYVPQNQPLIQPPVQPVQPIEPAQIQVADNTTFMQAAKVGAADMAGKMVVLGAIGAVMGDSEE